MADWLLRPVTVPREILACREAGGVSTCRECPVFPGCWLIEDFLAANRRRAKGPLSSMSPSPNPIIGVAHAERRALRIPIEQDPRLDDLLRVWREMVAFCALQAVRIGSCSMLRMQEAVYGPLRERFPEYCADLVVNANKFASEMVKACLRLCRLKKPPRFPNLSRVDTVTLRAKDVSFTGESMRVIYKPGERIKVRAFPSEGQRRILEEAGAKAARLVRRKGHWIMHLTVDSTVEPREGERP